MQQEFDPAKVSRLSRRELLKLSPALLLGAFAVPALRRPLLQRGLLFADAMSGRTFRPGHAAATFDDSQVVPLDRFPFNGYDQIEPPIDFAQWKLEVTGLVAKAGGYTLDEIRALPRVRQNTRHVCVEGWDAIGNFGGVRIADFLAHVGADTRAAFLMVECADDYYESLDMATALHPMSLLCYEMYGEPLLAGHGAPLRLSLPTKLGYKSAKYLMRLEVTNVLRADRRGYWADQGYSWYAGL